MTDDFATDSTGREVQVGSPVRLRGMLGYVGRVTSLLLKGVGSACEGTATVHWDDPGGCRSEHPTWDLTVARDEIRR